MAQHRDAPAYQEYAASIIASTEFRAMTMAERGLLWTLRLECWTNGKMPAEPARLARVLGCAAEEIERALPALGAFLTNENGYLRCPELDDYRTHLEDRRLRQSQGGRAGAAKTNGVRSGAATGKPPTTPRVARGSLVQNSQDQHSKDKLSNGSGTEHAEWLNGYERESRGH